MIIRSWPRYCKAILLLALVCVGKTTRAQSVSNDFWQAQSIYQILTDRFFDGDTSNNNADGNYSPANSTAVHGGDFKGVEQKLDYIKALGATAIWISPVIVNASGQYHGYAGRDFYNVAAHWGNLAALQQMVQAAHSRGLLVINDIIVNHGGDLVYSTESGYANFIAPPGGYNLRYRSATRYASPFNTNAANPSLTNLFHNNGAIQNFGDTTQSERGELFGLDDFRTESPYVRSNMVEVYKHWIAQAGFDGFRVDTVKHAEMGFWQEWSPLLHAFAATNGKPNFFMFGEVLEGSDAKCGSYTGTKAGGTFALDSVLDYPLYFTINSVFATASGATKQIEDRYHAIAPNYDPAAHMRLVTFLDNHDQRRFLNSANANGNTARLQLALLFLYTARGIPCLYYGTEQAFNGGSDPNNREDMFDGSFEQGPSLGDNFNMTHPMFLWVAKLNNFRRLYPPLQLGSHINQWYDPDSPGLFAYARRLGTQEVFVVFNTASTNQTLPNRSTILPAGTKVLNLFDTNEVLTITATPQFPPITVAGTSAKVFVSESDWRTLDPVVVSNSPAHDAAGVPTYSPIVLRFSAPMNSNSVQGAFSTTPAVNGTFAWSAARDTLTWTPGGAGLPGLTNVIVRLSAAAHEAVTGKPLFAPYELRFRTAASSSPPLKIETILINGTDVRVSCSTLANRSYQLQFRHDLTAGSWSNAGPATQGTGGVLLLSDAGGATNESKYYRVRAL
jgi:alpha-amylase